jgi:hypothetical protein
MFCNLHITEILSTFEKLGKATVRFVMSLFRLSARMHQLGFHWADFYEIWYLKMLRKLIDKFFVSLVSNMNNGYIT